MRYVTVLLHATAAALALASAPVNAESPESAAFSVHSSELGNLLDNPGAKSVLEKHIPALVSNQQIQMARSMTLKQIQQFAPDLISDEKLAQIQADLDKISKQ